MAYSVPDEETLAPDALHRLQRQKLARVLAVAHRDNPFYREKLNGIAFDPAGDAMSKLPFTTRAELQQDQLDHPPYGSNLSFPLADYRRLHQTSGSRGRPLRWLDTAAGWTWFKGCWRIIYAAADTTPADRLFFPFTFGPFIGFWAAFEAAVDMGCFVLPAGGMSTQARLAHLLDNGVTVVCCTPTYAMRMAEVAREEGLDLAASAVRALIVAGEPGGCIAPTRAALESAWGATVFDHAGMTELGAWGFQCASDPVGMWVIENEFIAEVVDQAGHMPVGDGELGELVLTNLGREGSPLIRYRTGDLVRLQRGRCIDGRWFARLEGGILGRCDDMLVIRGNNVFPSAIEAILRELDDVAEYRLIVDDSAPLVDLALEVEPRPGCNGTKLQSRVTQAVRDRLHFRAHVTVVEAGALPRFEMKAKRVVRRKVS